MIFLFDLDGTLIDSTEPILNAFSKALNDLNYQISKEKILPLIGDPLSKMLQNLNVNPAHTQEFLEKYKNYYAANYLDSTILLPNAKEAILQASKNGKVALVTTKRAFFAKEILKNLNLIEYFDAIVGGDEVKECKPAAEPIFKALSQIAKKDEILSKEELNKLFDFSNIFMIGDTLNDTQAAKNAGVNALVTLFKYTKKEAFNDELLFDSPLDCVLYALKNCQKN